jgi:hypothetical protein
MSPALAGDLACCRIRELRQSAGQSGGRRGGRAGAWPLRRQLGFTLVEVGLRLLADPARTGLAWPHA